MARKRRPVTFRDALKAARSIGLDELREMSREDQAALVLATALKTNGCSPDDPAIDWESLIAFIEKIMPLILMLIELFS